MKTNINAGVKVEAITFYVRENIHSKRDEMFVCITMLSVGAIYVTFTRYDTEFAKSVKVGDVFVVSGKFKREQVYNGYDATVITNCKRGASMPVKKVNSRTARINAKLGLACPS